MPEISEIARIVHFIRKHLVSKTLSNVLVQNDDNVYGKAGTTAAEFQKQMTGKKVLDVGQQGKYFWLVMSSPPHPLMHFGMAGWLKMKDEHTYYYREMKHTDEEWPPKYWKFVLQTEEEPKVEAAFVDFRRFGRIRLLDCAAEDIRKVTPLKENGPDPVVDKDLVTEEWLVEKMKSKKAPVKAVLLDQANISGIGNWVGDEVMYHAKIHPEQYSNTLTDAQLKQLHQSIHYVCSTAVELLGDSEKFPDDWLFRHRWGKGKKDDPKKLPNGERIVFLTVGGRTSAVVPSVQKKTGPVTKDIDEAEVNSTADKSKKARKSVVKEEIDDQDVTTGSSSAKRKRVPEKPAISPFDKDAEVAPRKKGRKAKSEPSADGSAYVNGSPGKVNKEAAETATAGRRRSARISKG